ncbi:uncharacterized protein [Anoplolepis gracilipes]|uniref:uncharacterized protein n=1 Tax=Anoplolepis gracilipes TaxID=354296 RepID=UPI003BA3A4D5
MEVLLNNKDFNEKERFITNSEVNISEDIPRCNDEEKAYDKKDEENVEGNLQDIACDAVSINNSYVDNEINRNKLEDDKESELRVSDKSCNEDSGNNNTEQLLSKKFLDLIDSDSENETLEKTFSPNNEHLKISKHKKNLKNKNVRRVIDSESEDDTQNKINDFSETVDKTINITTNSYQSLIDSESEEEKEEVQDSVAFENYDISENKSTKKEKSIKKRKGSIRASKDEAMRQIHSETQRLMRETGISLPYHRPKQRTLQEFLNRKKVLPSLPKAPSIAAKLKMSSVIVRQVVAEKEREAELFYKSSDSEEDIQSPISFTATDINLKKSSITCKKMLLIDVENTCIQESQKIDISNQSIHNEEKIIQDIDTSISEKVVSEKDFNKVDYPSTKDQNRESSLLTKNSNNHNDGSNTLSQQIDNEYKQHLQKLGVSRKLFDTCFESEISKDSNEQKTEKIIETIINSLEQEKCVNNEKKSEISMTENHISEISQVYDSEALNINRDKNLSAETIKVSDIPSNISNKEMSKTLQRDNDVTDNIVTSINSDDSIIIQDENVEKKDKYDKTDISSILTNDTLSKTENNSLTEESKDSDSNEFGLPFSKFVDETLIDRKKLLANATVTLKGSPGMIIDLTSNVKSYGKGINTLLDRFFCKHVINPKKQVNDKSQETVMQNIPNDLPIEEVLPYKLPANTDNSELNKPGAKLMRLKEDLKLHMTIKRNKEWKHKEIELREKEEKEKEEWDEEEESDYDSDGQEKVHNLESSDSGESEPEENDVYIKDKKRSKCLFADDEAEVTDNEDSSTDVEETYSKNDIVQAKCNNKRSSNFKCRKEQIDDSASEIETDQNEEEEVNDSASEIETNQKEEVISLDTDIENESDSKDDDNSNVCKNVDVKNKKDKKPKQLIEESQDDLNITNSTYPESDNQLKNISININTCETQYEDNSLINEKSNMPANQQDADVVTRSQINKTPLTKKSMLDFVSPITQLSVLNTPLNSSKKNTIDKKEYLVDAKKSIFMENTQSDESSEYASNVIRNKSISKKKLFDDIKEPIDDEYLMRLCSGKFESTQKTDLDIFSEITNSKSRICPENSNIKQLESLEIEDENSQDVKLILDEDSNNSVKQTKIKQASETASELKLKIVSSDDDDQLDETDTFLKPRKRSVKRLHLSDSEEEESAQSSDEENDDMDKETEEQYVDYDSEENEIVPEKDIKKVAAGFLEEEAELSESDWDSADEDEKDLDKLEYEEADDEHIDEHEMEKQLETIHKTYMRQMLDEDKREVRLLQEILFEDGDLHTNGMGRERKFKWRNIDKLGSTETPQASDENDGWIDVPEDEEETKWSKLRQERDKFLEERMKCSNNEIEDELNSQIFKFGLEALKKIKGDESQELYVSDNKIDSSENIEPIMPRNITDLLNGPNTGKKSQTIYNVIKKRSLLARGEESLAKIASLAKQGDSASHTINARNFVFQYINPNNSSEKDDKTRKEDQDLQTKPRKRKMSNFSSTTKKRRK